MAYAAPHSVFGDICGAQTAARQNAAARPGILRRLYDAALESRQRQTNREIGGFLARSGGRITDDLEREMTERFLTGNRNFLP